MEAQHELESSLAARDYDRAKHIAKNIVRMIEIVQEW